MGLFDNKKIEKLKEENQRQSKRIKELENLCEVKDAYFKELMSDGMRHGSKLASKHMKDRKDYLNGK